MSSTNNTQNNNKQKTNQGVLFDNIRSCIINVIVN